MESAGFNKHDIARDACQLFGAQARQGYDWWWHSSNNLTSEISGMKLKDSVFDIGGGRPKIGPLALPRKLLSAFWYEGEPYEFNFSKAWTLVHTEFDCKETDSH